MMLKSCSLALVVVLMLVPFSHQSLPDTDLKPCPYTIDGSKSYNFTVSFGKGFLGSFFYDSATGNTKSIYSGGAATTTLIFDKAKREVTQISANVGAIIVPALCFTQPVKDTHYFFWTGAQTTGLVADIYSVNEQPSYLCNAKFDLWGKANGVFFDQHNGDVLAIFLDYQFLGPVTDFGVSSNAQPAGVFQTPNDCILIPDSGEEVFVGDTIRLPFHHF
mmetsp:Transcript_29084/g.44991  ORF Transcript_29084/g.44991 Transcript_29084/m.44991 type:complete len:219 (-) Transcript_29084:82-738(-)